MNSGGVSLRNLQLFNEQKRLRQLNPISSRVLTQSHSHVFAPIEFVRYDHESSQISFYTLFLNTSVYQHLQVINHIPQERYS